MAKRSKAPARPNSVQDKAALINAIARKGELDRQKAALCAEAEAQIAEINHHLGLALLAIEAELAQLDIDVQGFAEANKAALLPEGLKTARLTTGDLGWRADNPKVAVTPKQEAAAIVWLEAAELPQFVRVTKTVNKEAILATHSTIENMKAGTPEVIEAQALMTKLLTCPTIKIKTGKESFWFTPNQVKEPTPEHAGAPADAVAEGVAAWAAL